MPTPVLMALLVASTHMAEVPAQASECKVASVLGCFEDAGCERGCATPLLPQCKQKQRPPYILGHGLQWTTTGQPATGAIAIATAAVAAAVATSRHGSAL